MSIDSILDETGFIEDCIFFDTECEECVDAFGFEVLLCLQRQLDPYDFRDEEEEITE